MAKKSKRKMKWWKNPAILFPGIILAVPAIIFATAIGMVVKKSAMAHPTTAPTQVRPADDLKFALDAYAYAKQGQTIALYGINHTKNVVLNSAASRLQANLAAPLKKITTWCNRFHLTLDGSPSKTLLLPEGKVALLNSTSDRNMAYLMVDYANKLSAAKSVNLVNPTLIQAKTELQLAVKQLSHDVNSVVLGN